MTSIPPLKHGRYALNQNGIANPYAEKVAVNPCEAEISQLRAALEAVEWIPDGFAETDELYCPWCQSNSGYGHAANCKRQAALQATGESDV